MSPDERALLLALASKCIADAERDIERVTCASVTSPALERMKWLTARVRATQLTAKTEGGE